MKKFLIIFAFLGTALGLQAQQGEIIFKDFEPDTVLHVGYQPHELWIDFDKDNLLDLKMYWYNESPGTVIGFSCRDTNVNICQAEEGETIPHLTGWTSGTSYPHLHDYYAIRIEKEGNYYYGWFRTYVVFEQYVGEDFFFDKYAFCTIPDYPLQWGQTTVTGVEENDDPNVFATLHPNPTNSMVIITGENLRQAEVVNTLGQQVLSVQGRGNELQIDMAGLPAGIYFVAITNEEGHKCVRKVVKE